MRQVLRKEAEGVPKGVVAGGDTCGMRYPGLFTNADPTVDRQFTFAVALQQPEARLQLIDDLLAGHTRLPASVRLRLELERVRTLLRAGRIAEAEALLARMPREVTDGISARCISDVNVYAGMVASMRGRWDAALAALQRAVVQDPFSFQARVLHLKLLYLRQLRRFRSNAECAAAATEFIEGLHRLRPLLNDPRELLDFADLLGRQGSPRTKPARLAIAYAYLWGGQPQRARRHASEGLALHSPLPRVCSRLLDRELEHVLAEIEDRKDRGNRG